MLWLVKLFWKAKYLHTLFLAKLLLNVFFINKKSKCLILVFKDNFVTLQTGVGNLTFQIFCIAQKTVQFLKVCQLQSKSNHQKGFSFLVIFCIFCFFNKEMRQEESQYLVLFKFFICSECNDFQVGDKGSGKAKFSAKVPVLMPISNGYHKLSALFSFLFNKLKKPILRC